jgi:hypothetical protein
LGHSSTCLSAGSRWRMTAGTSRRSSSWLMLTMRTVGRTSFVRWPRSRGVWGWGATGCSILSYRYRGCLRRGQARLLLSFSRYMLRIRVK